MQGLIDTIETAWARKSEHVPIRGNAEFIKAVQRALELLDSGSVRMAEKAEGAWRVNQWLKKPCY